MAASGAKNESGPLQLLIQNPTFLPESAGIKSAFAIAPEARFAGSLVETVDLRDAEAFLTSLGKLAGITSNSKQALRWFAPEDTVSTARSRAADALTPTADLLKTLADVPGVSGHEGEIRRAILASLPTSSVHR